MSLYHVQKLLFQLNNSAAVRRRFQTELEELLAEYRLTPDERRAIVEADVGRLYLMGVAPLLLAPFSGRAGLRWPDYIAAIRRARETAGQQEPQKDTDRICRSYLPVPPTMPRR